MISNGKCPYCGQVCIVEPCETQAEADKLAAESCGCPLAMHERQIATQVAAAIERMMEICGAEAAEYGFPEISDGEVLSLLGDLISMVGHGRINKAKVQLSGCGAVEISLTAKGRIKVNRTVAKTCGIEE